ncbi:S-adenosyl-L-methionine-dependent methyltransferase [Aspergillus crustosus]
MSSITPPTATQGWTNLFMSKDFASTYKLAEQLTGAFGGPLIDQSGIALDQLKEPPTVFDNACGTGIISSCLNSKLSDQIRQKWKLTCGDFSEGMVGYTKQRAIDEGWRNAEVKLVDAQDTQLPNDHFTHIFASFAFASFPDSKTAMKECFRILQPEGTLAATTWKEVPWITMLETTIKSLSPDLSFPNPTEYHDIFNKGWNNESIVQARLEEVGFKDVKTTTVTAQILLPIAVLVQLTSSVLPALLGRFWTDEQREEYEGRIPATMRELLEEMYGVDGSVPLEPVGIVVRGRKL